MNPCMIKKHYIFILEKYNKKSQTIYHTHKYVSRNESLL